MKLISFTLKRNLVIEKFDAIIEIARQEKRDEIISVLELADELGGRVRAQDLCSKLLVGRPEPVGRAIIERCAYYDLLNQDGELTTLGHQSLETGQIFVPERGRYTLWYTDDRLLPRQILHVEPSSEPSVLLEVKNRRNNISQTSPENATRAPDYLKSLQGRVFEMLGKGGGRVLIKDVDDKCMKIPTGQNESATIYLSISEKMPPRLRLDGSFRRELACPEIEFDETWLDLLDRLSSQWEPNRKTPALRCKIMELSDTEKISFLKNLKLTKPKLHDYGEFDDVVVADVPVMPSVRRDANSWALWLLRKSVANYLDEDLYGELSEQVRAKFPEFAHDIELPSRKTLAREIRSELSKDEPLPKEYWYLQAPLDLSPERRE